MFNTLLHLIRQTLLTLVLQSCTQYHGISPSKAGNHNDKQSNNASPLDQSFVNPALVPTNRTCLHVPQSQIEAGMNKAPQCPQRDHQFGHAHDRDAGDVGMTRIQRKHLFLHGNAVPNKIQIGKVRYGQANGNASKQYDQPLLKPHGMQRMMEEQPQHRVRIRQILHPILTPRIPREVIRPRGQSAFETIGRLLLLHFFGGLERHVQIVKGIAQ
mmetsp:Transcript_22221/g.38094  ORF Transcript_22221/g.38094 Transcript_22221/m.38094 type:complete len:214 (+) Transcript_22221:376-1017(+)